MFPPTAPYVKGAARPADAHEKPIRKLGLVPLHAESMHRIPTEGGGFAHVTVRPTSAAEGRTCEVVCLHADCTSKRWPTMEAMRAAHPLQSVMEKAGAVHVYGLWCGAVTDPGRVEETQRALDIARADKARINPVDEGDPTLDQAVVDRYRRVMADADLRILAAEQAHAAASAVIGLVAPPPEG